MKHNIIVFDKATITPEIVKTCISKFNSGKDDGDIGFKSDHIINGTHRLNVLLLLLFNTMISHGYTPTVLLKSTIVSIPKDNKASLSNSDMQFGYKKDALQRCVLWFIKKLFLIMLTIIQAGWCT